MAELNLKQKLALKKLKDYDVDKLTVHYSGGGDDGCIDQIQCLNINGDPISIEISHEFDDWLYQLISDNVEWDWVNNEGGYGELNVTLGKNGTISIEHSQRVIENYSYGVNHEDMILDIIDGPS